MPCKSTVPGHAIQTYLIGQTAASTRIVLMLAIRAPGPRLTRGWTLTDRDALFPLLPPGCARLLPVREQFWFWFGYRPGIRTVARQTLR